LGNRESIEKLRTTNLSRELFIAGILFIMGMYHFSLFFLRREDPSPLFFGIYCIITFFRTLIMGELYLNTLFPNLSFANSFRIEYLTIYLGLPIFVEFVRTLFPSEMNKYIRLILISLCLILTIIVLLFPPLFFTKTLTFFHLILLFTIIFIFNTLIKAIKQKREGAKIFLFGVILFALTIINDLLYSRIIINTGFYAPLGLVAFLFSQSYLLSARFSKAFSDTKEAMRMAEEQRQLVQTAKEEIERLGRTKDEFLANLSHEIKTPLVTIYGYSEMITLEEIYPIPPKNMVEKFTKVRVISTPIWMMYYWSQIWKPI
jgi:signal transduction histidine kinase